MKGILYSSLLYNRGRLISCAVYTVIAAAAGTLGIVLSAGSSEYAVIVAVMLPMLSIIAAALPQEVTTKEFENNLKIRFADYTLAAVTKGRFVSAELIKNLIYLAFGLLLSNFMYGVFYLVDLAKGGALLCDARMFAALAAMALLSSIVQWAIVPLTIKYKSCEKASLIIGVIMGAAVVYPVHKIANDEINIDISVLLSGWFVMLFLLVIAALYAVLYLMIYKKVKRGNIC